MTNLKHTPGPWFMEAEPYDSYYQISDDFSTTLAQVEAWDGDNDEEVMGEAKANARLIAAAPDYNEIAHDFLSEWESDDHESLPDMMDRYAKRFRNVIAKAKAA